MSARTIHPFPARMAPELAINALPPISGKPITVMDPMCGAGTVLSAAVAIGHRAIGFDLDPLAVAMSRVASTHVDAWLLAAAGSEVASRAGRFRSIIWPWDDDETTQFAEFWFGIDQRIQLAHLARAITAVEDDSIRNALYVALSRMIVTKSPRASLAADTAHSRPHRVQLTSDFDVIGGFRQSVLELCRLIDKRVVRKPAVVRLGDARILPTVKDGEVDLVITSPPYLNAIDYMRGHRLALIWHGYSIAALRNIRSASIGAERKIDEPAENDVKKLLAVVLSDIANPSALPAGAVERYAHDLCLLAAQLGRVTRVGGSVVAVVGNSTIKSNFIRNDKIFEGALEMFGFELFDRFERPLPENRRYLPISTKSKSLALESRMRTEVVLSMRNRGQK